VPSYELPSNILGLTFTDPIQAGIDYAPDLQDDNDVVIALTHIGFTTDPKSVEVDNNVDTYFAAQVPDVDAVIGGHSHTNPATGFGPYKFLPTYVAGPNNVPVIINQAYRYNTNLGEVVLGLLPDGMGGYKVVSRAGRYIPVPIATAEDPVITGIVGPYQTMINAYNNTVIGDTITPIDTTLAFTQETNGANLQADASIWKLEDEGIPVDFHLSGAMTNRLIATTATPATPYQLKVSDMFAAMPYENSLVVLNMNGPQLEAVLERAYRNYFYYKYVPGYGGYSYYTTCMLDTGAGSVITYNDLPAATYDPNVDHVGSLVFDGHIVDFSDASTYYRVSTVNYLAAGACNFSDSGVSLWPLNQIAADTQYYVRDAVIEYIQDQTAPINPQIEGRLSFVADTEAPVITINSPTATSYPHPTFLALDFSAVDVGTAGLLKIWADLDGVPVTDGQVIDLLTLALGDHTLTVYAEDKAGNESNLDVTFSIEASITSLKTTLMRFYGEGEIDNAGVFNSLNKKLVTVEMAYLKGKTNVVQNVLLAFINEVMAQKGVHITEEAAELLIADAYAILGIPYP
jgi:2',3'-cyclic-nucleotide 2'-phosphodiesterase (5'-nucleotidase family)